MAKRIQCTVLMALALVGVPAWAEPEGRDISAGEAPVLDPRIERRKITEADIDSENWEVSAFAGIISLQDFDVSSAYGARLAYHLSEDLFFEAEFTLARAGETSFEKLSPGVSLVSEEDRDLAQYSVSVGYNMLPGESFLGASRAFNNCLYLIGGAGVTDFLGDNHFTINAGLGYRLLVNDWLAVRVEMRDFIFETDVFGAPEITQNLAWTASVGTFF